VIGTKYFAVNQSLSGLEPGVYILHSYLNICHLFHRCLCYLRTLIVKCHHSWRILVGICIWTHLSQMSWNVKPCFTSSACRPLPINKDELYGQFQEWVFEYMDNIRDMAQHQVPYTLLRYILQYPWWVYSFMHLFTYSIQCLFSQVLVKVGQSIGMM